MSAYGKILVIGTNQNKLMKMEMNLDDGKPFDISMESLAIICEVSISYITIGRRACFFIKGSKVFTKNSIGNGALLLGSHS